MSENRLYPKLILAAKLAGACSLCFGLVLLIIWLLIQDSDSQLG
jgi:hypothetical protein